MRERELVFPLVPSRKSGGLEIAGRTSRRRGSGSEIASSRPYRRGDTMRLVDWAASARLSTAHASDEFVVRDHFAEDAVRVMVVVDRSPSMALFPDDLPWLHKAEVVQRAGLMILVSAAAAHALTGFAETSAAGVAIRSPRRDRALRAWIEGRLREGAADGPRESLDVTLETLAGSALDVPSGSFVFVLSDFLPPPSPAALRAALAAGWDLIPVIVQDPLWEQSFPRVGGVTLPLADPSSGALTLVRLRSSEAEARRVANEQRMAALHESFLSLGIDPVTLSSADWKSIHGAFLAWAEGRSAWARRIQ
ncbi:MAG: DUF58 domain-containing protein [Gaiellaceae bacterium]